MSMWDNGVSLDLEDDRECISWLNSKVEEMTGCTDITIFCPTNRKLVVREFNNGLLHKLIMYYHNEASGMTSEASDNFILYLVVCLMELGVTIGEADMDIFRSAFDRAIMGTGNRVQLGREARNQVEKALKKYKSNGDAWDFQTYESGDGNFTPGRSVPIKELEKYDQDFKIFLQVLHRSDKEKEKFWESYKKEMAKEERARRSDLETEQRRGG